MQFVYLDDSRRTRGPFAREELQELFHTGVIHSTTLVRELNGDDWFPFAHLPQLNAPASEPGPHEDASSTHRSFREQTNDDWLALKRHILVPWNEARKLRWLDNQRLVGVAAIGLFPLLIIALINSGQINGAYWAMAFYFSALWGVFFYYVFPAPGVTIRNCLICFFGTGLFSVSLLIIAYYFIGQFTLLHQWTADPNPLLQLAGWFIGVGLPEELCKVLVLIYLERNNEPFQPQTMLYYGLMAGLGFGIYEGVAYQRSANLVLANFVVENYYILNVIRLTALPFIHAIWTAIAGYFIGFAFQYPERRRGLLIIAVALPATLHGLYNALSRPSVFASLAIALFSVFLLNLYLAKSRDFERVLQRR